MMTKEQRKIVGITAIGGALEFYDFTIYALFAPYISQHFFSNTNPLIGFINTFAVFALGYLARPLGGVVFGHFGDTFGRKSAFSLAVFIMAIATLLIGCLPSYQSLGIGAPILLIGLRLIQGFSVGGEIPGAAVFIMEHVPRDKQGFSIGFVFMCITLGNTLGAGVGVLLTALLNQKQMMDWGWRIPFIIGFFLGIISYAIRKKTMETPVFVSIMAAKKLHSLPFLALINVAPLKLVNAFFMTALTSSIISLLLYLPTYLSSIIKMKVSYIYVINAVSFLSFALITAFFGRVSDYVNRKKLLMKGALLVMVLSYPLFSGLSLLGEYFIWIFILGFVLFAGMVNGSYVVMITELFPANMRYSGVGFSYSLGVALFGGFAPLAFTGLIHFSRRAEAPAFYIMGCALLTFLAVMTIPYQKTEASGVR